MTHSCDLRNLRSVGTVAEGGECEEMHESREEHGSRTGRSVCAQRLVGTGWEAGKEAGKQREWRWKTRGRGKGRGLTSCVRAGEEGVAVQRTSSDEKAGCAEDGEHDEGAKEAKTDEGGDETWGGGGVKEEDEYSGGSGDTRETKRDNGWGGRRGVWG